MAQASLPAPATPVRVIVRVVDGAANAVVEAIVSAGGAVEREIGLIDSLVVTLPPSAVSTIEANSGVVSVTPDGKIELLSGSWAPQGDQGSMLSLSRVSGATDLWRSGYTGEGVDVAVIDSGIVPVQGLDGPGKVVNAIDLSFDAPSEDLRYMDSFGHGTHLAGIIAGRDGSVPVGKEHQEQKGFLGIAPGARLVNVKVGATNGVTDVSQVIAAIDWIVRNRQSGDLNVQVLSLAFGTDSDQAYTIDPLAFAAEMAWHSGITVVVAAGNSGSDMGHLADPATDPYVIAVGADDPNGTYATHDDVVPEWSARGDGTRNPDLLAPGVSVVSLRDPGSFVDSSFPGARVDERFFRGTGTSQAAAVVAGAAALLEQQRPGITPDETKALLTSTARSIPGADATAQGAGLIDLGRAMKARTPVATQSWPRADGSGSLEASRGSIHVIAPDGTELSGEQDVFGQEWDALRWGSLNWEALRWSTETWTALRWSDLSWDALRWGALRWSALRWSGVDWSALRWSALRWSALRWSALRWSSTFWNDGPPA